MKPEIKKVWLEALRSGEYKKGIRCLRTIENEFCCLGVLCDIYNKETGNGKWIDGKYEYTFRIDSKKISSKVLPSAVMEWAGLDHENPNTSLDLLQLSNIYKEKMSIAMLNDKNPTFEEVIKQIEIDF